MNYRPVVGIQKFYAYSNADDHGTITMVTSAYSYYYHHIMLSSMSVSVVYKVTIKLLYSYIRVTVALMSVDCDRKMSLIPDLYSYKQYLSSVPRS